jgi:shikimate kinase/3-dehydroquinate synthase
LPVNLDALPRQPFGIDRLLGHMGHDKKVVDGRIAFIVANGIGHAEQTRDVPMTMVREVLAEFGAV